MMDTVKQQSINEIIHLIVQNKSKLKKEYGVKEIGIFGSYVRGEQKDTSDIDILVSFYPKAKMNLIKFVELENFLSALLGGIKVDLVTKAALKPRIGKKILNEVIYIWKEK